MKGFFRLIKKRYNLLIMFVALTTLLTGFLSILSKDVYYTATTKLIVSQPMEYKEDYNLNLINVNIQLIKTYKEIIKSPRIMRAVTHKYPDLNMTPNQLASKINVVSFDQTQILSIVAVDLSKSKASDISNKVTRVFIEEISNIMNVHNIQILSGADEANNITSITSNTTVNVLTSLILSIVFGMGLLLFFEYLDDTVKTEKEVLDLINVPILSQIPNKSKNSSGNGVKGKKKYDQVKISFI